MPYSFTELVMIFFTYSVIGWIWETFYCSIKDHHYDYRGFLFGPYCPVYGFAVTTILVCTDRFQDNILLLFIVGMLVATVFEYFASLFLQKVFHMVLWDYSHLWGNIQGRVAPIISLFWGIGVVALVKWVQPFVQKIINWEESTTHGLFAWVILCVMSADFICTIISVEKFHTSTQIWDKRLNAHLEAIKQDARNHAEDLDDKRKIREGKIKEVVSKQVQKIKPKLTWNEKRFINSYSKLKFDDAKRFEHIKQAMKNKKDSLSN